MSELKISHDKRVEWIQKNGGADALDTMGVIVENLSKSADEQGLKYKESDMTTDVLGEAMDSLPEDAPVTETQEVPITEEKEAPVEVEVETDVEAEVEITEEAVKEAPVAEAEVEVEDEDEEKSISFKEVNEIVDYIADEVVGTLIEQIGVLNDQNKALSERVNDLEGIVKELSNADNAVKEVENLPSESASYLVKQRIMQRLGGTGFESSKPLEDNDKLKESKPVASSVETGGGFAGFVEGR